MAMLAGMTILSQFYRVSNGVIAPELIRDLGLTPAVLGFANGVFFLPLGALQIPCGILFDRYGPRRTVAALTVIAVAGAGLHAVVESGTGLAVARFLLGVGCGGSFMSAVVLSSRWFPGERLTTVLSWVFALSNLGTLLGATPLAWAAATIGWRGAFVVMAVVTALVGLLFFIFVRDAPDGAGQDARAESLPQVVRGLGDVFRMPGLPRILAIHLFAYASMLTVLGLWAGPYLHDVYGLDAIGRGNVLLAMGAGQVLGILCYGPLDRLVNSRKKVVIGGALLTILVLGALAIPERLPVSLAVTLLVLHSFVTAYGIVIVAHGRSLFPAHLAGRGVTVVNMAQVIGCAGLPIGTGFIVDAFTLPGGGAPLIAYRMTFAVIAILLALGLWAYTGVRDSHPRTDTPVSG
jgi:predicted MFS family arabinose efflux permease